MRFFKFRVVPAGTSSPERMISVQFLVEFLRSSYPVEPIKMHGCVVFEIGFHLEAFERYRDESNVNRIECLIMNYRGKRILNTAWQEGNPLAQLPHPS